MSSVHTSQVFTRLTVTGSASSDRWGHPRSECLCVCGQVRIVCNASLLSGNTKSCSCYSRDLTAQRNHANRELKHKRFRDLTGLKQRDGRLTALRCVGFAETRHAQWECR